MKHIGRILTTLALLCGAALMILPSFAYGASNPVIVIGDEKISKGNKIWFGNYDSDYHDGPILWRILGDGNSGSGKLLLTEYCVDRIKRSHEYWDMDREAMDWWSAFDAGAFTDIERKAMIATTLPYEYYEGRYGSYSSASSNGWSNLHIFFLSAQEAEAIYFSVDDNDSRVASKQDGNTLNWWLRSTDSTGLPRLVAVSGSGAVGKSESAINSLAGARPAMNIDPSSVLLVSAATGGKSVTAGNSSGTAGADLYAISAGAQTEWKLTLKDDSRKFDYDGTPTAIYSGPGDEIGIPYLNAQTEGNEFISVLLCDSEGKNALYYGSVKADSASGTAVFRLPDDLPLQPTDGYLLRVFNEQKNEDKKTDYASQCHSVKLNHTLRSVYMRLNFRNEST